jgi:hypothetical protein
MEAQSDDPILYSVMLFLRLRTNLRGYMLLWHDGSYLNADILLRSMVECTICLAAISAMGAGFIEQLRADAASSVKRLPIGTPCGRRIGPPLFHSLTSGEARSPQRAQRVAAG